MSKKNRKIIYSPGYGAGWVSWASSKTREQRLFMLEYQPFIEILESGKQINSSDIELFEEDWRKKFPDDNPFDPPYTGGLGKAEVMEVPYGVRIRIDEYDGSESVELEGEYDDWY